MIDPAARWRFALLWACLAVYVAVLAAAGVIMAGPAH